MNNGEKYAFGCILFLIGVAGIGEGDVTLGVGFIIVSILTFYHR